MAVSACLCAALASFTTPAEASSPKCTIIGSNAPNTLRGTPGPDVICGLGGDDTIIGGAAADRISGGPGKDKLRGGAGTDVLLGGPGQDRCWDSASTLLSSCSRGSRTPRGGSRRARGRDGCCPKAHECCSRPDDPDTQAPYAVYFSFLERYVDTSAGTTNVGLYLEAADPSGIGSIDVEIDGPSGPWRHVTVEGSSGERATFNPSIEVPSSTPDGDYRIVSLTVSDKLGNARTLSTAEIQEAGYRAELAVFHGPDTEGPQLTSLTLSPAEVDTSQSPGTVVISLGATDAVSGVNAVRAAVQLPGWEPGPLELISEIRPENPPELGTRHDGTWQQSISLVKYAMPGYYKISGVYLSDLAGNTSRYTRQELIDLGFPVEFLETGEGDTTPPEILDLWFEPTHLRTSAGERTIFFYLHVRDDLTGLGQWPNEGLSGMHTSFDWPGPSHEFTSTGRVPELVSGSETDGVWRHEVVLEPDSPVGEYKLEYASATDRAGNALLLDRAAILSHGWPSSFVNEP